ncbi:hypothetical protein HIM_00370 [Hirsutella minnesotensis 3608]|nr:hypothetical protein HIM_00370 [Hirsutella minnesotensis 3608]
MPPRIPTEADFAALATKLPHVLHFPSPRESTTAILVLLHGLGDTEAPFARFAQSMALPGVLAISSATKVLVCQLDVDGDDGQVDAVEAEFRSVTVVRWRRRDVSMPRDRDEMFPIMKFLADRLRGD